MLLIATVIISAPPALLIVQANKEADVAVTQSAPTISKPTADITESVSPTQSTSTSAQPTSTTTSVSSTTTQQSPTKTSASPTSSSSTPTSTSSSSSSASPTSTATSSSPTTSSTTPAPTTSSSTNVPAPTLYLPYSTSSNLPSAMTPMGETIYHPKPQNPTGHPGIDFQWEYPSTVPTITASMDATIYAIIDNTSHAGTFDVSTKYGQWGVDYAELGSVKNGLKVGDSVKVGDTIGTPQHPANITDLPNFRMIHWQFGYATTNSVGTRLCPMSYFASSAKTAIETLWANTNSPEMKNQFPNVCSGDYAEN